MKRSLLTTALVLAGISASHAAITYVDATTSNTTGSATYPTTGNLYADNLWSIRTLAAADAVNATIFEAGPLRVGGEDVPLLTTQITGLTVGQTYQIYTYYVSFATDTMQPWQIQTGLAPGSLTTYVAGTGASLVAAGSTDLVTPGGSPVTVPTNNRSYFQASLGTAVANSSGSISVYVDAPAGTLDANNRTWYDGVGYQLVPEPSSALLGLFGAVTLLRRRR